MVKYIRYFFGKIQSLLYVPLVLPDYFRFKKKSDSRFSIRLSDLYPCVGENTGNTSFDRHYTYHTAWAARKVKEIQPEYHTDISSSLYFSSIVSAFVPVKFYDYRPAKLGLSGLESGKADLLALPFETGSIQSLSCMHVVEHVGLGRYGDPINPQGDKEAAQELSRVISSGGNLLFVVPVGIPRIQFNAHRIYSYEQVIALFPDLKLKEFSLIPQYEKNGGLIMNADSHLVEKEQFACGCFWFQK